MKSITRHTGRLTDIQRMDSSYYGNPRFSFMIDGYRVQTTPDSMQAYGIQNYANKVVTMTVGYHYGKLSLNSIDS